MQATIAKWGNSLALRLPRHVAAQARLSEGATVELHIEDEQLIVTPSRKRYRLSDLLAQMEPDMRRGEEDWGKPRGEEVW
jgi:antitoxin MazE